MDHLKPHFHSFAQTFQRFYYSENGLFRSILGNQCLTEQRPRECAIALLLQNNPEWFLFIR